MEVCLEHILFHIVSISESVTLDGARGTVNRVVIARDEFWQYVDVSVRVFMLCICPAYRESCDGYV